MIIYVRVKLHSTENILEKISDKDYVAFIHEPAHDGKANLALIKMLAKEFSVTQKNILIKTPTSRKKIVEVILENSM